MQFQKRIAWPSPNRTEIIGRSKILIIDDQEFPYKKLFDSEGYNVTKWNVVRKLSELENGLFDLILLDLQGVAIKASIDDGIGILRHIRETNPYQMVIAFSNADFPLQYQPFFDMADGILPKTADYGDFKKKIDDLLISRFSKGFYSDRLESIAFGSVSDLSKLQYRFDKSVTRSDLGILRDYLQKKCSDPEVIKSVLMLANVAIKAMAIWIH